MKCTIGDCVDGLVGVQGIMKVTQPPEVVFHFADLLPVLRAKTAAYSTAHNALIEELGEPIELGKPEKSIPQNSTAFRIFVERLEALRAQEVDLPGVKPLERDKLGKAELRGEVIVALGPFLKKPAGGPAVEKPLAAVA